MQLNLRIQGRPNPYHTNSEVTLPLSLFYLPVKVVGEHRKSTHFSDNLILRVVNALLDTFLVELHNVGEKAVHLVASDESIIPWQVEHIPEEVLPLSGRQSFNRLD